MFRGHRDHHVGRRPCASRRRCALTQVDVRRNRNAAQGAEIVERWAGTSQLPEVLIANRSLVTDGVHMRAAGCRDDATILADTVSATIVK